MDDIGERFRQLRIRRGLTQEDIERLTGIDQGHVSMIERGRRKRVSAETVAKLAKAVGCSMEDLVARPQPAVAA